MTGSSTRRRILIVSDLQAGRDRLSAVLREAGFEPEPVGGAVELFGALETARPPFVILVDASTSIIAADEIRLRLREQGLENLLPLVVRPIRDREQGKAALDAWDGLLEELHAHSARAERCASEAVERLEALRNQRLRSRPGIIVLVLRDASPMCGEVLAALENFEVSSAEPDEEDLGLLIDRIRPHVVVVRDDSPIRQRLGDHALPKGFVMSMLVLSEPSASRLDASQIREAVEALGFAAAQGRRVNEE